MPFESPANPTVPAIPRVNVRLSIVSCLHVNPLYVARGSVALLRHTCASTCGRGAHVGSAGVFSCPEQCAGCGADTVYIATPQFTHIELSLQTLAANKHFLCEKPLGLNGTECLGLLKATRESDRITSCSNYRRLSEQYKLTETMLKKGEIGKLVGGWSVYSSPFYNPGNSPVKKALGLSRIKELGFYQIDSVWGGTTRRQAGRDAVSERQEPG